jgi:hypothetical protein
MNQLTKLARKIIFTSVGVTVVATGLPVGALESTQTTTSKEGTAFCSNLSALATKATGSVTEQTTKWLAAKDQRASHMTDDQAKRDQEIAANRAKWDQDRQTNFAKLEVRATTDGQKSAVKIYETTIRNAVATRRAAYDRARTTYREALANEVTTRQATIDGQIKTLKTAVTTAFATAQTSCKAKPSDGPAIRTQLQASLKSAREAFTADRKTDETVKSQVKTFATQRTDSFKSADTAFQATTQAARDALKAAFKTANI